MLSSKNLLERLDGVLQRHKLTGNTSEDLDVQASASVRALGLGGDRRAHRCDSEGLRHEPLDLSCTLDGKLVLLGQLVHAENGNDVLETLVVLEDLLDASGDVVVLLPDDSGVEQAGLGSDQRVSTS